MMKLVYLIFTLICFSCSTNSVKTDHSEQIDSTTKNKIGFIDFANEFNEIRFPFVIGDSILWKSTLIEMRGLEKIDSSSVSEFLDFEYEKKDSVVFYELIRFYKICKISIAANVVGLIYLKSYNSKYVTSGKKDIYKMATFDLTGKLIAQKDIAGFFTDVSNADDRVHWNTCVIDKYLHLNLNNKIEVVDYGLDTSYVLSETNEKFCMDRQGRINTCVKN